MFEQKSGSIQRNKFAHGPPERGRKNVAAFEVAQLVVRVLEKMLMNYEINLRARVQV